ncbi:MAG: hypothetical protein LBU95_03250 [Rikenellaceae bacterium]|nr:hypothetical protein [Rikenellaceae bacterium]
MHWYDFVAAVLAMPGCCSKDDGGNDNDPANYFEYNGTKYEPLAVTYTYLGDVSGDGSGINGVNLRLACADRDVDVDLDFGISSTELQTGSFTISGRCLLSVI